MGKEGNCNKNCWKSERDFRHFSKVGFDSLNKINFYVHSVQISRLRFSSSSSSKFLYRIPLASCLSLLWNYSVGYILWYFGQKRCAHRALIYVTARSWSLGSFVAWFPHNLYLSTATSTTINNCHHQKSWNGATSNVGMIRNNNNNNKTILL